MSDDVTCAATLLVSLPKDWHIEVIASNVDAMRPGLYEWRIESVGVYIGKYTRDSRPRKEYRRNIVNLLNAKPYRKNKPDRYRAIHRHLAKAYQEGRRITLTFLANIEDPDLRNEAERQAIDQRRAEQAQGGLPVLNGN